LIGINKKKMETKPKISIVLTTFNREQYCGEAIQSILNQTYTDFELIVVDNYSNYDFNKFIQNFSDSRIRGYQNQNSGIIATNRNFGISKSEGDLIAFCDDDDIWERNKLESQIKTIELHPNFWLYGTNCSTFPNGIENDLMIYFDKVLCFNKFYKTRKGVITSSVIIKNDVIKNCGLFDTQLEIQAIHDFEFWLRILSIRDKSVYIQKESLVKYRVHPTNFTLIDDRKMSHLEKVLIVLKKYPERCKREIEYFENNIVMLNHIRYTKEKYYENIISTKELFNDKKMGFLSKIQIFTKKSILKLLKKKN